MGRTIAEKIFSEHCGKPCSAGDIVVCSPDTLLTHDANRPLVSDVIEKMGTEQILYPERTAVIIDHYTPSHSEITANIHSRLREFAKKSGTHFFESEGICHQLLSEKGLVSPGDLVIGSDSHMCTQGALNAFASGVGSTDLAVALTQGNLWFQVPSSYKIELNGSFGEGVYAKDLILHIVGELSAHGAVYKCLEFSGNAIPLLSIDARMTVCNMVVETGAKAGIMPYDDKLAEWLEEKTVRPINPATPDIDAAYSKEFEINLNKLSPLLARPHRVDDVVTIEEVGEVLIRQANLAGCAASRLEDLLIAAKILKGHKVHKDVRLMVVPASQQILLDATREGIIETLVEAGGILANPSCKACSSGPRYGVPADGENVITSANRNFQGRVGNPKANIYLASPATVAASAITGYITDCREFI